MNIKQLEEASALSRQYTKLSETLTLLRQGARDGVRGIKFICKDESARKYDIDTGGDLMTGAMFDAIRAYIDSLEDIRAEVAHRLAKMGVDVEGADEDNGPRPEALRETPPPSDRHKTGDMWTRQG